MTTGAFLAIDIGNTTIAFGVLHKDKVLHDYHVETTLSRLKLEKALKRILKTIKGKYSRFERIAICSVVPGVLNVVEAVIKKEWNQKPVVIGRDIPVPIKNNYQHPEQVGHDRLVCAYAVKRLYGTPAIVIDFGTAITFDFVSRHGRYEGGMIVPGIRLSAESLFHKTALLPRIETIARPRRLIGKNTKESILSGLFFGYGAMACGLIELISQNIKGNPRVMVTGGYTDLMRKFIAKKIDTIDPYLVYKGIYYCCQMPTLK